MTTTVSSTHNPAMTLKVEPQFYVPANKVALTPFPTLAVEKQNTSGFVTVKNKLSLVPLKVVFGNENSTGTTIYAPTHSTAFVRGDSVTQLWAKEIYEVDGIQFILAPVDAVQLVSR